MIAALAAQYDLQIYQMDVKTAFLNGELTEAIYMKQPTGYIVQRMEEMVCKFNWSMYGLKQSLRCWNYTLDQHLKEMVSYSQTVILVYIFPKQKNLSNQLSRAKSQIASQIDVKDMGPLNQF